MRRVIRTPVPSSLDGPQSAGGRELAAARAFYDVAENRRKAFPFEAYKKDDVRAALRAMFHRKCAYCEAFYAATMPDDIEHYRPKAEVRDGAQRFRPGYWWLAMSWKNLLPSCADCNRARRQEVVGQDRRVVVGKANQFPLEPASQRATAEGTEDAERPLLLDPTVDDPARHLEFRADGSVHPAVQGGAESVRGRATIEVVALMRRDLVDERELVATQTAAAIRHVRQTFHDIVAVTTSTGLTEREREQRLGELRARLAADIGDMERTVAPSARFSALSETLVQSFMASLPHLDSRVSPLR